MSKLCERPGCSEVGAAEYGMVPEDLLFWIAPLAGTPHDDQNVLCLRHADAMSVPRGWTLDDRREEVPRLFMPRSPRRIERRPRATPRPRRATTREVEQLVIDGTGEIERPAAVDVPVDVVAGVESVQDAPDSSAEVAEAPESAAAPESSEAPESGESPESPWRPDFDQGNDLDGLLEVSSPLLARAFRGTDRPRD